MKINNLPAALYDHLKNQNALHYNPYLRQVNLSYINEKDISAYIFGKEINPTTRDFIASAKKEVLMQFFKYASICDASTDICEGLIELDKHNPQGIDVKLMIDQLQGPGKLVFKKIQDNFSFLKNENGIYYVENQEGNKHYLTNLKIKIQTHKHVLFNSYHTKQIIIDRNKLMLRSGDVNPDTNYKQNQDGRREMAHIICNEDLAKNAADSFLARFQSRNSKVEQFNHRSSKENERNIPILLIEKQASSSPLKRKRYTSGFKSALIMSINASESLVQITTPNLNDKDIIASLIDAANRGVNIEIIMGKYHNHMTESFPTMGGSNIKNIEKIYNAVPLSMRDNINVRWAKDAVHEIIPDRAKTTMHCKLAIVDNEVVLSGSSPLDNQASYYSAESDFVTQSPALARYYQTKIFNPLYHAGENVQDAKLASTKEYILNDIHKHLLRPTQTLLKLKPNDKHTREKIKAISTLILKIKNCDNFSNLESILSMAKKINLDNPFAHVRCFKHAHLFNKVVGKTKYINELDKLYDTYINQHMNLAETNTLKPN